MEDRYNETNWIYHIHLIDITVFMFLGMLMADKGKCTPWFTCLFILWSLLSSVRCGEVSCETNFMWIGTDLRKGRCFLWQLPVLLEVPSSSPSSASALSESTAPESWEMLMAVICWVTGLGEPGLTQQKEYIHILDHQEIIFLIKKNPRKLIWSKCWEECFVPILLDCTC